jgi:hypothetical protein
VDPDVLLVDEVLAVGDEGFTHKCLDKFAEFRRRGKTILLVTHALGLVERFCDEALWIDEGHARGVGDPRRVVGAYVSDVEKTEEATLAAGDARARELAESTAVATPPASGPVETVAEAAASGQPDDMFRATEGRWGTREVEVTGVTLVGTDGQPAHVFQSGERVSVRVAVRAAAPVADFVFGIGIFNAEGVCCYGTNTDVEGFSARELAGEGEVSLDLESLDLVEGTYKLDVAVHRLDGRPYDYHRLLYTFRVKSRIKDVGVYRPRHRWTFSPSVKVAVVDRA